MFGIYLSFQMLHSEFDSPTIDIPQMDLPPSIVTRKEQQQESGNKTTGDLDLGIDLDPVSSQQSNTTLQKEPEIHQIGDSSLEHGQRTMSKSVEPIIIQPAVQPAGNFPAVPAAANFPAVPAAANFPAVPAAANFPISTDPPYSFTELEDVKYSEDSNFSALDMLEGLENVESFSEEGQSMFESSGNSNIGFGEALSVKSEDDRYAPRSPTIVDLTSPENPTPISQEEPRVLLKDCSHMLSEEGTAKVENPSTSTKSENPSTSTELGHGPGHMVTDKEPKQDFVYNYKKFANLNAMGRNILYKAVKETGSVVKVAREYSRKFGFLLTEENVREHAVSKEGSRAVSRHVDVSVDDHQCSSLTPGEKAKVGKFASKHGTGAAAQWAYDALGKVVSRTTVNSCTVTKQKRAPLLDPKKHYQYLPKTTALKTSYAATRISVAQKRFKSVVPMKPALGQTQKRFHSLVSKRSLQPAIQKDTSFTYFIQNCGFSWQEQRHILASAVHNGVVPTARFFTTKNNRLLSELLVKKIAARAGKEVESKAADISKVSENSKSQIVQYFTKMRKYDRSALKIIATADEFSRRTGLPLSEDMIANIVWPKGRGSKDPTTPVKKDQ